VQRDDVLHSATQVSTECWLYDRSAAAAVRFDHGELRAVDQHQSSRAGGVSDDHAERRRRRRVPEEERAAGPRRREQEYSTRYATVVFSLVVESLRAFSPGWIETRPGPRGTRARTHICVFPASAALYAARSRMTSALILLGG